MGSFSIEASPTSIVSTAMTIAMTGLRMKYLPIELLGSWGGRGARRWWRPATDGLGRGRRGEHLDG